MSIEINTAISKDRLFVDGASLTITPALDGTFLLFDESKGKSTKLAAVACSDLADLLQRVADQYGDQEF